MGPGIRANAAMGWFITLTACGGDNRVPGIDAAPSATITVSGNARTFRANSSLTEQPIGEVTITAHRRYAESAVVATGITDIEGNYAITIPLLDGEPFDGFLKAEKPSFTTTYHDLRRVPVDLVAAIPMITTENFESINSSCSIPHTSGATTIMLVVADGSGPVLGASIETVPAPAGYCYNANGFPAPTTAETSADGVAFAVGVPAGAAIIKASKAGSVFQTAIVRTFAESLTTTSTLTPATP